MAARRTRTLFASLSTVLALTGAVAGAGWVAELGTRQPVSEALTASPLRPSPSSAPARPPATSTTTTSAAPPASATTAPQLPGVMLPVPELLPEDEWAPTPEVTIGTIEIPRIGLHEPLHQGMALTAINRGPSHWPGTAVPGQLGNVVVGGHRTTYTKPFRHLDRLDVGDSVLFTTPDGRFDYRVTAVEVVEPHQLEIVDQDVAYEATLFACHPPGSAAYRLVVELELVDQAGRPVPPPAVRVLNQAEALAFRS